ncbi:tripartite tricarboxylate transporter substrate binding protein [Candidimonas sp. SYP-B2681]|uniref:Bug family tripartite tricarboxylate transporter substrate binding protein n=1 Tax=Candidimonas sp. SYP-B2681 TaxID=2497686 RepID=UPI000F8662E5|nr:tripartite tricarboxylate transporter substrate binding protein [Candidimonas sp. SYP-B2681]RTZ45516.1 tripartite tricarboxylate transporter substrate binding protein [Candidimonas sp. SYP-B2681]
MTKKYMLAVLKAASRCVIGASALALAAAAHAEGNYPDRPVTFIVPYPAGAASDTLARLIASHLQKAWGQPVVVQNKPGAVGTIGVSLVARSRPDGYTVLVSNTSLIQLPAMMSKLPFDTFKDLTPVVQTVRIANLFVVPKSSPAKSLDDFVKTARLKPGQYNYGTWGAGSSAHIHGELLSQQTATQLVPIPYQGSAPMMTNLLGGQINSGIADAASVKPHAESVRVLAVTGPERIPAFPDVPTFTELGYKSFEARGWHGLFVPAGTPSAIVDKISVDVNRILKDSEVQTTIESFGIQPGGGTPEEFATSMRSDAGIYSAVVKAANIRLD